MKRSFNAGIFEQSGNGWERVVSSTHRTERAAELAAKRYASGLRKRIKTGGSLSWASWFDSEAGRQTIGETS